MTLTASRRESPCSARTAPTLRQHLPGLVRDAFRNLAGAGVLGSETGGEQEAARHHPLRVGARGAGRSAGTDGLYAVVLAHPVRSPSRSLTPA